MSTLAGAGISRQRLKSIISGSAGNLVEWYDWFAYASFAIYFAPVFFPKADPTAPHEVLLVLDANIGQNALAQVKAFDAAIGVTGLVVTKLDGTAKGGVIAAIARQQPKPLRFIGVGEGIDDLQPFSAREFVDALFSKA